MKVVAACSGGKDSLRVIRQLSRSHSVIALTLQLGQRESIGEIEKSIRNLHVKRHYTIDARDEYYAHHIIPAIMANYAHYGAIQPHALSRAIIVKYLVQIAREEKADAVAHGASGKGNDQIRIENGIRAIAPSLKIIALPRTSYRGKFSFADDENLFGRMVKGGTINDIGKPIPEKAYSLVKSPEHAPDKRTHLSVSFEHGLLASVRIGARTYREGRAALEALTQVAAENGVGRMVQIEDKLAGGKRREVYEVPAAYTLMAAHKALESVTLTSQELRVKATMDALWSELVYEGKWFSDLRKQIEAYIVETQRPVTGTVQLSLYKGTVRVETIDSPYSLVSREVRPSFDAATRTLFSQDLRAFVLRHH